MLLWPVRLIVASLVGVSGIELPLPPSAVLRRRQTIDPGLHVRAVVAPWHRHQPLRLGADTPRQRDRRASPAVRRLPAPQSTCGMVRPPAPFRNGRSVAPAVSSHTSSQTTSMRGGRTAASDGRAAPPPWGGNYFVVSRVLPPARQRGHAPGGRRRCGRVQDNKHDAAIGGQRR